MHQFKDLLPINKWFDDFKKNHLIIAGPCSAESRKQVIQTAEKLKETGKVHIFRAGLWKPRTRPGSFEGVGSKGLKWLQEVKEKTGLKVGVEVAKSTHVKKALSHDIDMVWIGTRTTSNPFSVQELANQLEGSDLPVLVKNPINPDLDLWVGAIERLYLAGIKKIAAVHRGFYPFEQTKLRNIPKWEVPIELKTRINELPLFCDPSHISGNREFVGEIAQKALDLNMNGLMIESHIDPASALSDAKQQLSPEELDVLLSQLIFRSISSEDRMFLDIMESLREKIDSIDKQIIELLAQRMSVVKEIGQYKRKNKVTIFQLRRWERIIKSRISLGMNLGLSENFLRELLNLVHKESIKKQEDIMNKKDK
jgi:chorismate mutase